MTRCLSCCTQKLQYEWTAHSYMHMQTRIHTFARTANAQQSRGAQTHTHLFWQSQKPFKRATEKMNGQELTKEDVKKRPYTNTTTRIAAIITIINFVSFFFSLEFYFQSCLFSVWSSTLKESDDMIFINVISEFQRMCSFSFDQIIRLILILCIVYLGSSLSINKFTRD